jgi:CubicO group peptidase (beta-lactamase class C family)
MPRSFVAYRDTLDDGQELDLLEHINGAADQRLTDRPRYMYSNSGYFILAEIIEAVDGRSYTEYVEDEVFAPLNMDRSGFDPAILKSDEDAMTGYRRTGDGLTPQEHESGSGASGGLISSVTELAALLQCVLNTGVFEGRRILSDRLIREMYQF